MITGTVVYTKIQIKIQNVAIVTTLTRWFVFHTFAVLIIYMKNEQDKTLKVNTDFETLVKIAVKTPKSPKGKTAKKKTTKKP
jgi:hypothetical protein